MTHALSLAALAASALLLLTPPARVPAIFALLASGLQVLMTYGLVNLAVSSFPVGLALGVVLLAAGIVAYLRVSAKGAVSAATVAVLVGAIEVLRGFKAF